MPDSPLGVCRADLKMARTGYDRPRNLHGLPNVAYAWRKGWRKMSVACPKCKSTSVCAHLCWPGDYHCHDCHEQWWQEDTVVFPAMVKNPEAE